MQRNQTLCWDIRQPRTNSILFFQPFFKRLSDHPGQVGLQRSRMIQNSNIHSTGTFHMSSLTQAATGALTEAGHVGGALRLGAPNGANTRAKRAPHQQATVPEALYQTQALAPLMQQLGDTTSGLLGVYACSDQLCIAGFATVAATARGAGLGAVACGNCILSSEAWKSLRCRFRMLLLPLPWVVLCVCVRAQDMLVTEGSTEQR